MEYLLKPIIIVTLPLVLVACGGGGNDNAAVDNTAEWPTNTAPLTDSQQTALNYYLGSSTEYTNGSKLLSARPFGRESNKNYVVGKTHTIIVPSDLDSDQKIGNILVYGSTDGSGVLRSVASTNVSYRSFQVSDDSYRYSRIGFYNHDTGHTLFHIGSMTLNEDFPTSGNAVYRGDALVTYRNTADQFTNVERGTVAANFNFGNKTGIINLKAPSYSGQMNVKINTNTSTFSKDEAQFSRKGAFGIFHGPTGEEVTGGFYDFDAGMDSVFAAKRQ